MSTVLFLLLMLVAVALILAPILAGIAIFQVKKAGDVPGDKPTIGA